MGRGVWHVPEVGGWVGGKEAARRVGRWMDGEGGYTGRPLLRSCPDASMQSQACTSTPILTASVSSFSMLHKRAPRIPYYFMSVEFVFCVTSNSAVD